ncbi:S8 family serine peptidase [Peribacillus sp. NPDC046944]|uniref:S8 family peptidase n=1 Tax=unclassified Peribacillus TaxID=2675266 RepID=UPI003D08F183
MRQKKTWLQTMAAITLATSAILPVGSIASAEEESNTETDQLIVKYKTNKAALSKKQMKNIGVEDVEEENQLGLYDVKAEEANTAITKLEKMDNVEYVEKNVTYQTAETIDVNDTYYKNQWNLSAIDAQGAWENVKDNSNLVKVAVLDTGVQGTHEDLAGRVLEGKTFVEGYDAAFQGDDQGHGTFVSGIIAANANNGKGISGIAGEKNVQILPVKVMNKSGVGDAFNIAQGIDYAVEQGADVINMSISGEYSETIEKAVKNAADKGIVVVAASGNGGGNADASYPAALPNVLSVGAVATKDQVYERSNYGSTLDIVAPGVNVLSTSLLGDLGTDAGHYSTGSGTSYAAPHVAAVAALYKLNHPEATSSQVEEALTSTAIDLNEEGWDEKTGHGKLNAKAALADDVETPSLAFVLPKKNANVVGTTTVQVAINDANTSKTIFYTDEVNDGNVIGEVKTASQTSVQFKWDTTKVADGSHQVIAVALDSNGKELSRTQTSVKVVNAPQSGYMFTVTTPSGTIAKGASVKLYEKVEQEDDTNAYGYNELWAGTTDTEGAVRVPSHVGTDLKNLQVVVQGKFDTAKGNSWFMYSREVASSGTITLKSENTVPVALNTVDEEGKGLPGAQYFIAMKDAKDMTLGSTTMINEEGAKEAPTVYLDKGAYNIFSYHKAEGKTYFLSNTAAQVGNDTKTLNFDSREAGEVAIDNRDKGLENGVLYLYNDAISEAIGSDEVITGQKFFVTPGDYDYMVDAEVKDPDGGENWVYVLANDKTKAVIKKNKKTVIKAGGSIDITKFEPDQESLKNYYKQRGLTYIERPYPNIAYKLDRAFYTKQTFGDDYGNKLAGMYRGSLHSEDALYKKDVNTGKTVTTVDDEAQIETINFGDIYSKYKVMRLSDNKVMLDSHAKNATNPANRQYYFYSFWVTSSSDVTEGKYEISLTLDENPLAKKGLYKAIHIDMQDSGTTMQVKNEKGDNVPSYITINRLEKTEDGDSEWVQSLGQNTDTTKSLSLPSNLELSDEENGNMAIIRYTQPSGEYSYIFRQFTSLDELKNISIPDNMQKVAVTAMDGDKKLDGVSTRLWMIKKPVTIGGQATYVTANNLQNYKYDSIYLEPGNFVMEGNYVSLPDENNQKANYYFLEPTVQVKDGQTNTVVFDKEKLAQVKVSADATGYSDVRGAIIYPYNEYSQSFIKTLRVGHTFYVPSNLKMDLQVQLGLGDNESANIIWNYFLSKGEQTFQKGQKVQWQVGGDFKANITLSKTKLLQGDKLSGHTSINDAYGNAVSSVLVNQSTDFSIADDALIAYEKQANGQIVEKAVKSDYTISHGGTTASASSVKPVLRIYDKADNKVFEDASLEYYGHIDDKDISLKEGQYRAELALAASPKGPIASAKNTGLFQIGKDAEIVAPVPGIKEEVKVPTISPVTDQTTVVKGKTTPKAVVTLKNGKKNIKSAKADKNGQYTMKISKQKAGTKLSLSATLKGYKASKVKTITVLDRTAPTVKVKPITVTDKTMAITIVTEKNVTMTFTAKGMTYTKPVYKNGKYTLKIAKLPAKTKWTLIVKDKAGNKTKKTGVVLDRTAPKAATVEKVTTTTTVVKGKAEKKATVTIYKGKEKVASGKVNAKGAFSIKVPKQKANTILHVVVQDEAKNKSKVAKVKVGK